MIEEIFLGLYRIEVPLPKSPLKALNSYLIKGRERSLIIDTGFNRDECLQPMQAALKTLDVDLTKTDFFITHLHADHSGLVATLATDTSKVYFNKVETSIVNFEGSETRWTEMFAFYISNGFPLDEFKKAFESHPGYRYSPRKRVPFTVLGEGDTIVIDGYSLKCIETPGHSPGHMCLYEPDKKIFICGDHILFDITPNITWWPELPNSLNQYLISLAKVYSLDVALILPGHRSRWDNHKRRITELYEHHSERLNETLSALGDGTKTAWEVAPYITWDIDCDSWEEFPPTQKWFAIGETIAHLDYLVAQGKACKETKEQKIFYSLV